MAEAPNSSTSAPAPAEGAPPVVLLIDDQPIVGHAVKEMLKPEGDIQFHFCREPLKALDMARAISPTVILQDLVMPEIDGLTLLKFFRANASTAQTPMIVLSSKEEAETKAQAFALGANDYLVKLPDRIELVARIRHHSQGYIAQLQRNEAYRKLAESERVLAGEMAQAAKYVRSLLPKALDKGLVRIDWRFVPSTHLGGDAFGYHWLDANRMVLFLLDVSGHGVGAALMAVSVLNTLTSKTLPDTDFGDPAAVMKGLNAAFSMEKQGGHYFTIWYGVFDAAARTLKFSGGGHPPAILYGGASRGDAAAAKLETLGPPIGMASGIDFENASAQVPAFARLLLYSDGAVEINTPEGKLIGYADFDAFTAQAEAWENIMDRAVERAKKLTGSEILADDCSLMLVDL
jgi:sigma-B regulation protein RsbU (phosphoserine phosphatase)